MDEYSVWMYKSNGSFIISMPSFIAEYHAENHPEDIIFYAELV